MSAIDAASSFKCECVKISVVSDNVVFLDTSIWPTVLVVFVKFFQAYGPQISTRNLGAARNVSSCHVDCCRTTVDAQCQVLKRALPPSEIFMYIEGAM